MTQDLTKTLKVLDKGHVTLYDHYGDDLRIVNFARASFGRMSQELGDREKGLIKFLVKNRHGTPLEAVDFSFHIRAPLPVAVEWWRHRMASINALSLRYVKPTLDCYTPVWSDIRTQVGKPGHYEFQPILDKQKIDDGLFIMLRSYEQSKKAYDQLLELGWAKELARNVLPMGLYTEFWWKANARSIMNFLSLRNHPLAMTEIRYYADAVEWFFQRILPLTHAAFLENGRVAP